MGQYIGHFTRVEGVPAVTIEFFSTPTETYLIPEEAVPSGAIPGDTVFVDLGPLPHKMVALRWDQRIDNREEETKGEWIDIREFLGG
jgi:hypothetical protein